MVHFMAFSGTSDRKKVHKLDKLTDAVYCHIQNYQFREECKQKQEATAMHVEVRQQNG
jgi:hypothetical protein